MMLRADKGRMRSWKHINTVIDGLVVALVVSGSRAGLKPCTAPLFWDT